MSFLTKLDKLMKDKNINKSQLSKDSGVPYTTIDGFYKKGTENIKLSTLKKLSSYFGCSLDYLADDDIPENSISVHTIAAHHDKEDWTDEELNEIEEFKKLSLELTSIKNTFPILKSVSNERYGKRRGLK